MENSESGLGFSGQFLGGLQFPHHLLVRLGLLDGEPGFFLGLQLFGGLGEELGVGHGVGEGQRCVVGPACALNKTLFLRLALAGAWSLPQFRGCLTLGRTAQVRSSESTSEHIMKKRYLGIEIGGTKLQFVVGDDSATILERRRFPVDPGQGGEGIRRRIQSAVPELLASTEPQAVAVGFGGPVDWKTGKICCSHQVKGWADFELGDWLRTLTGLPVFVENDANTATLGEALHGAGVGFNPVFYVTLGSGVGGGLVVDGRIYHGAKPGEAEIGHVRLDRQGTIVESRCSGWAVDAKIRQLKTTAPDSLLCNVVGGASGGEAKHLVRALEAGDHTAQRILKETAEDLAFGLSHVVHLFHPEVIVLGGGLSLVGEPLRSAVEQANRQLLMEAFAPGPRIALAVLGEDAVPVGALALAHAGQRGGTAAK
jgi:glucokinase